MVMVVSRGTEREGTRCRKFPSSGSNAPLAYTTATPMLVELWVSQVVHLVACVASTALKHPLPASAAPEQGRVERHEPSRGPGGRLIEADSRPLVWRNMRWNRQ